LTRDGGGRLEKVSFAFSPENKKEWDAIRASLKTTFGAQEIKSESFIETIRTYFKLESNPDSLTRHWEG
jgi:hypothetical protein